MWVRIIHLTMPPTRYISELKYAPTHDTFPSFFLKIDKTPGAYSLQIYDYLSQTQRETKAFLQIARHTLKDHQFLTGSEVIACSSSSSDR